MFPVCSLTLILTFNCNLSFLKERNVWLLYSGSEKRYCWNLHLHLCTYAACLCQVSDPGGWLRRDLGVSFHAAAGERSLAEVSARGPCPLVTYSRAPLHARLVIVIWYQFPIQYMGTAAPQHDNGALLIITNSDPAQVMMAKMYLPQSWDEQFRHSAMKPQRHGDNWSHCSGVYAIQRSCRWVVLLLARITKVCQSLMHGA